MIFEKQQKHGIQDLFIYSKDRNPYIIICDLIIIIIIIDMTDNQNIDNPTSFFFAVVVKIAVRFVPSTDPK